MNELEFSKIKTIMVVLFLTYRRLKAIQSNIYVQSENKIEPEPEDNIIMFAEIITKKRQKTIWRRKQRRLWKCIMYCIKKKVNENDERWVTCNKNQKLFSMLWSLCIVSFFFFFFCSYIFSFIFVVLFLFYFEMMDTSWLVEDLGQSKRLGG